MTTEEKIIQLEKKFTSELEALKKEAALVNVPAAFEVGKWYKNSFGSLFNFQEMKAKSPKGFGFTNDGVWYGSEIFDKDAPRLATPEEIQSALVAEAKKRYKGCEKAKTPSEYVTKVCLNGLWYDPQYDQLVNGKYATGVLYQKGEWATIITEPEIKIGGYKAEYSKPGHDTAPSVKFGCKTIFKSDIQSLSERMKKIGASAIIVEGHTITIETIEKVRKGFNA